MNASSTSEILESDDLAMREHRQVLRSEATHDHNENLDDGQRVEPGATDRIRRCTDSRCWLLTFLCVAAVGQSMSVNGLIGVTISTIELRFGLSSSQTAWITSAYELAGIPALLVVGYIGSRVRRPVWIAGGLVLLSVAIFVYTLPHFVSSLYRYDTGSNGTGLLCQVGAGDPNPCKNQSNSNGETDPGKYLALFIISSMLMGIGSVPLFVLGVTYIDDFDANSKSALDIGLFYSMGVIGPVLAFIGGGYLLNLYVDFNAVAADSVTITNNDPRWAGAWWLGFLISLGLVVLTIVPIVFFPANPLGMVDTNPTKNLENEDDNGNEEATEHDLKLDLSSGSWREIPKTVWSLLTNWTFLFTALYGACDYLLIDGFQTFGAKYFQQQFSLTSSTAGMVFGAVAVPGGVGGFLVGSYLIKRYTLTCRVLLPISFFLSLICLGLIFAFTIQCDTAPLAGVTDVEHNLNRFGNLNTSCNDNCGCSNEWFRPVCGDDDTTYFSACYAGCRQGSQDAGYSDCSCLSGNTSSRSSQINSTGWTAVDGVCAVSTCQIWRLILFVCLFLLTMFLIFVCGMFHVSIILRVVPHSQRPLSYAVDWMLARLLGATPGPVLFGYILDHSCMLWENKCSTSGACLYYDNHQMGWLMFIGCVSCKLMSTLFGLIAWRAYVRKCDPTHATNISSGAVLETCQSFSINRANRVSILDEFDCSVMSAASSESEFFEDLTPEASDKNAEFNMSSCA